MKAQELLLSLLQKGNLSLSDLEQTLNTGNLFQYLLMTKDIPNLSSNLLEKPFLAQICPSSQNVRKLKF